MVDMDFVRIGMVAVNSWIEVSEERLAGNYRAIAAAVGAETDVLAVVKANGYGHGAEGCSVALAAAGARWFGVTDVGEGARVRRALSAAGFALQDLTPDFELGPPGAEVAQVRSHGAVVVDATREAPFFGGALPLGLVLVRRAAPCALTFEAPRTRAPDERIAMLRVAVVEALRRLGGEGSERYA